MIEVLKILENDARISVEEIAEMTGKSKSEIEKIISELEESGVILGFKTMINWEKIGVEKVYALIDLKITLDRDRGYDTIAERIAKFPEVRSVRLVSGQYDISVLVEGNTMKDVAYFVAEKIATLDQVRDTVTHFILKSYKEDGKILYEEEENKRLVITL
ncbi:MAG: Lrp/AsnC family transcriptional regulator [Candidatus Syntropharchaeia archaeon]